MANKLEKANIIIPVLLILLVLSISLNVYLSTKKTTEFFEDYVVAMNDYHIASTYFDLAAVNLDNVNWYSQTEDYYYDTALSYIDTGKDQIGEAKELLLHAKNKLDILKAPNEFYRREINNRIEQTNILFDLSNQYYLLLDYTYLQMYELLYGTEAEATRNYNLYNDLIPEINTNLQELSDVSQEIDLAWNSNWYPLFEGV